MKIRAFVEGVTWWAGTWMLEKLVGAVFPEGIAESVLTDELTELGTSAYVHPGPGAEGSLYQG